MLFLIGGAARTGKGILVRRLLAEARLPYLSLDVLKMGLARGAPEYALDPDAGGMQVAERLWPLVREMSHNLIDERTPYVFEGEILPGHVAALRDSYPSQVLACFLGYPMITPARKLHDVRAYAGFPNDWPRDCTDADLLRIISREIAFSAYLKTECARHHFPYFDTSDRFEATLDQVVAHVQATMR